MPTADSPLSAATREAPRRPWEAPALLALGLDHTRNGAFPSPLEGAPTNTSFYTPGGNGPYQSPSPFGDAGFMPIS